MKPGPLLSGLRRLRRRLPGWLTRTRSVGIAVDLYSAWIARHDTVTEERRQAMLAEIATWSACPPISVVMPACRAPARFLREAVESVLAQVYPHWELCIAVDRPGNPNPTVPEIVSRYTRRDARIRAVCGPTRIESRNATLAAATGGFVAFLDCDDLLPAHAVFEIASAIQTNPDAGIIYSDEDSIGKRGRRFDPWFKPDYNYELLLGQNMLGHLCAYRRTLLQQVGGFRAGMEGAQDHDLALRCIERLAPAQVIHIPKVLYHRRARRSIAALVEGKPAVPAADLRSVSEHLDRTYPGARVQPHAEARNCCRVKFPLPGPVPGVSIIVPTRNAYELLRVCLDSLFEKTCYADFEVIVVDNGSDEPALLDYLDHLRKADRIRVLRDDGPFNFAALNNRAVAQSAGEYVLLLNNDVEIIEPDWLAEMVSVAVRPGVGAVGARLWHPDRTLQHGGVIVGLGGVAGHPHLGLAAGDPGYFGRGVLLQCFSAVTAACLLVKRAVFDEVGGFDGENLAVAYNDVDFCLKILKAGYRNVWTPHAQLIHHGSATRGSDFAPDRAHRFLSEARYMQQKWGEHMARDPAFNVNLSLDDPTFVLGDAPRIS